YVYLYQRTDCLLENIKKRGRKYEQTIEAQYLEKINEGYLEFIKSQPQASIRIIDISNRDFVKNRKDYLYILTEILK
ncbi:MAG: deoxyguanosine kinase, partial [Ulvibacter sp.]